MQFFKPILILAAALLPAFGADFFPLDNGNQWTYRNAATGETLTMTVGTYYVMDGHVYNKLSGYGQRPLLVRLNEQNNLVVADEDAGGERLLTSFDPSGGWWNAPLRECEKVGQTQNQHTEHDGPAGPIREVLDVRYQITACSGYGVEAEQYAENIGLVRRVVGSAAGPVTFDLIYARIGKLEINGAPNAGFSASTGITPQGDLSVLLRLQTNPIGEVKLRFPTGQEFEVALRDESGNAVWKWSDGQFFAGGSHEKTIHGQWAVPVSIPREVISATRPGFTIQAWLTTSGAAAEFAVTVPAPAGIQPAEGPRPSVRSLGARGVHSLPEPRHVSPNRALR